ncbi:amidohydrolase family protein [Amycolatopsis acidiphila]|uniref:Amidohydrolase family protein n=1 Tax=Amycolatopsis acidiphila TaxID=715473 RepID=A0A558A7K5_9PSEU|nr:amidohydrolase family protein [Amycolatopsis acidiphila]
MHVVDFLQQPADADGLVRGMTAAGVDRAVIFGLPMKKKWPSNEPRRPHYYLDGNSPCYYFSLTDELVASLAAQLPAGRFAATLCGFDPTDQVAMDQIELVWSRHDCWRGIGEVMLRHDDLTNLTHGENPSAAHPALDSVFEFAAGQECPIAVHHDSSSPGRPGEHEYVGQLDRMLSRHSGTTVVWCHAGVSRRVEPRRQHEVLADLLERHPRLHADVSWQLLDLVLSGDGSPRPEWTELITRHPDRFVLGTDLVGRPENWAQRMKPLERLLGGLPPSVREAVASENALRLWWGE